MLGIPGIPGIPGMLLIPDIPGIPGIFGMEDSAGMIPDRLGIVPCDNGRAVRQVERFVFEGRYIRYI